LQKPVLLRSNHLFVFGLILLVVGVPLSKYLMSVSQMVLAGSFFLEGNYIEKFRRFFRNKAALVIVGILLMHIIGMLWTQNAAEGWKDIRIKLPILVLTVIMAGTDSLTAKQFRLVLDFFIASVFAGTMVSMAVLTGIIHHTVYDIRDIFMFKISHIRFALLTCIAIFTLLYFVLTDSSTVRKIIYSVLGAWFITFLFIAESLTGLSILFTVFVLLLIYKGLKVSNVAWRIILTAVGVLIPTIIFIQLKNIYSEYYSPRSYPIDVNEKTANGNTFTFDLNHPDIENGYPVWVYVCQPELRKEWNAHSIYNYDSTDKRGQQIKYTLIRFLASKGWRKDSAAVQELSDKEVHSIENGIANVNYQNLSNLRARLFEVVWEYDHFVRGGDASGHSMMQRLEFWKTAFGIIQQNPLLGVGTGDMPQSYKEQYQKMNTKLNPAYWIRAHNQYLAIAVAFGIFGLLYFLFALIYPGFAMNKMRNYFYVTFLITALLSMFTEDTLETQAGVTFFAFFNAFFLFEAPSDRK